MGVAGRIVINLSAGTAQFILDMERAGKSVDNFGKKADGIGKHGVTEIQAMSGFLRTMNLNWDNNIRAAERFLATTLGLGAAAKAIFPAIGLLATAGAAGEFFSRMGEIKDQFEKLQEAPKRIAAEFQSINAPLDLANDKLRVQNDLLEKEYDKLKGKPFNAIKLALDQARAAAAGLADELHRAYEEELKVLQNKDLNSRWFTPEAESDKFLVKKAQEFQAQTDLIGQKARLALSNADPNNATARDRIIAEARKNYEKAYGEQVAWTNEQLAKRQKFGTAAAMPALPGPYGMSIQSQSDLKKTGVDSYMDPRLTIPQLKGFTEALQKQNEAVGLHFDEMAQNAKVDAARAAQDAAKPVEIIRNSIQELSDEVAVLDQKRLYSGGPFEKLMASAAQADQYIDKVNRRLQETKTKLSGTDESKIRGLFAEKGMDEFRIEQNDKQAASLKRMETSHRELSDWYDRDNNRRQERIDSLAQETAAYNEQAEAAKLGPADRFEYQLKATLARGPKGEDAERLWTENKLRAEHNARIQENIASLREEAAAYNLMATDAGKSALARDEDKIQAEIANTDRDPGLRAAKEIDLRAKLAATVAEQVAQLKQQTAATIAVGNAIGIEAQREAELQAIRNDNLLDPKVAAEELARKKAEYAAQDRANGRNQLIGVGVKQGISDMVEMTRGGAKQMRDLIGGAFTGLSDILAQSLSGQKTSWASFFTSLSAEFAKLALMSGFQMLFGALSGGSGTGFFGHLGSLFKADGGAVSGGSSYIVGERGPEWFTPSTSGAIVPNHALAAGAGGPSIMYSIDARGTDPVTSERNFRRGLVAVHGSATQNSVSAIAELSKRKPR